MGTMASATRDRLPSVAFCEACGTPCSSVAPVHAAIDLGRVSLRLSVAPVLLDLEMQRVLAPKAEPCCACARVSAAQEPNAMAGWLPLELSCAHAPEGGGTTLGESAPYIQALLCVLQDRLMATVQKVVIQISPTDVGLRGAPLAGAVLQLLPLTLTVGTWPSDTRARLTFLAERLVRLTCQGYCIHHYARCT